MHTRTRNHSLFAFLGLALLINATIAFLGRRFATDPRLPFIAAGACVDMLVLVPVLYYWLVARRFASRSFFRVCCPAASSCLPAVRLGFSL